MARYEYKVVPAPTRGTKAKGVRSPEGRFAVSIEGVLNDMGAQGWEYLRAELLPSDERTGLTGTTTNWRNVLVFRRAIGGGPAAIPQGVSHVSDTGLPPLSAGVRAAPPIAAAAGAAPEIRNETPEPAPRAHPPLVASRHAPEPTDEDDEEQDMPDPTSRGPESGIEKVMRFTARRPPDRTRDKPE